MFVIRFVFVCPCSNIPSQGKGNCGTHQTSGRLQNLMESLLARFSNSDVDAGTIRDALEAFDGDEQQTAQFLANLEKVNAKRKQKGCSKLHTCTPHRTPLTHTTPPTIASIHPHAHLAENTPVSLQSKLLHMSHSYWFSHTLNTLVVLRVPDVVASHKGPGARKRGTNEGAEKKRQWGIVKAGVRKRMRLDWEVWVFFWSVSSAIIAATLKLNPLALYRAMRLLGSHGIFSEVSHDQFELTQLGYYLRSDVEGVSSLIPFHSPSSLLLPLLTTSPLLPACLPCLFIIALLWISSVSIVLRFCLWVCVQQRKCSVQVCDKQHAA